MNHTIASSDSSYASHAQTFWAICVQLWVWAKWIYHGIAGLGWAVNHVRWFFDQYWHWILLLVTVCVLVTKIHTALTSLHMSKRSTCWRYGVSCTNSAGNNDFKMFRETWVYLAESVSSALFSVFSFLEFTVKCLRFIAVAAKIILCYMIGTIFCLVGFVEIIFQTNGNSTRAAQGNTHEPMYASLYRQALTGWVAQILPDDKFEDYFKAYNHCVAVHGKDYKDPALRAPAANRQQFSTFTGYVPVSPFRD